MPGPKDSPFTPARPVSGAALDAADHAAPPKAFGRLLRLLGNEAYLARAYNWKRKG